MNFWNNYQYLCDKNDVSPYEVARKCGIKSSASVSYWRQGSIPKPSVLDKIAQYLNVTVSDLVDSDLVSLETIEKSGKADDPIYVAVMKLTPQKRALVLAFIAGLNAAPDISL